MKTWDQTPDLTDRALELGRDVKDTAYMLPYGFYLRAMFYNKKMLCRSRRRWPAEDDGRLRCRGLKKIKKLPGKYALLHARRSGRSERLDDDRRATMAGDNTYFNADGTSKFSTSEGWVKGLHLA